MDWFGGELIITYDGWKVLHHKSGISLMEAQLELNRWVKEHPEQKYYAEYSPYSVSMGNNWNPSSGRATS